MGEPKGDLLAFMVVIGIAIAFAELQYRREASLRWFLLATLFVILTAMLIWLAYG
jgi:membrane protein YdbS with pleckstrin-like domain